MFDIERIIVIAGAPRSGTSWLGQIFDSCQNIAYRFQPFFSHTFKDRVNEESSHEEFRRFFRDIYESDDPFLLQTNRRVGGEYPVFEKKKSEQRLAFKTCRYQYMLPTMLQLFPQLQVVAIVRHPCAVLASWCKTPSEFPPNADFKKEWRFGACKNQGRPEGFFGFNKWRELAWLYLDLQVAFPTRVKLISYKNLVDTPFDTTQALFQFLELNYMDSTTNFLGQCHTEHQESAFAVFKSKTVRDAWREELPLDIQRAVERELKGTTLEQFLC